MSHFVNNVPNLLILLKIKKSRLYPLILAKSADIVGGGVWGRRPHPASESTMLMSYDICYSL